MTERLRIALRRFPQRQEGDLCVSDTGAEKKIANAENRNRIANTPDAATAEGFQPASIARQASLEFEVTTGAGSL